MDKEAKSYQIRENSNKPRETDKNDLKDKKGTVMFFLEDQKYKDKKVKDLKRYKKVKDSR